MTAPAPARFAPNLAARHRRGRFFRGLFFAATLVALIALAVLIGTVVNRAFGLVAVAYAVDPATISHRPLPEMSHDELQAMLEANASRGLLRRLEREKPLSDRSREELLDLLVGEVLQEQVVQTWTLWESITRAPQIEAGVAASHPEARLSFRSWINGRFLTQPMSSHALEAGVRTAVLGSLLMGLLTMAFAIPLGVATAVYLEEYTSGSWARRIIQTNIDNLAGVPSIIYGMLGLALFVRFLEPLTSGAILGVADSNGRTILAASLTMALLILPVIIINAQEALRAVPRSLRQASFGLGATRGQTVWSHVLPAALPGILTGTILGVSRLVGETAPLIIVGASTYIVTDPNGLFSKFTALPIQIYNWTSRPQPEFAHLAAAAILVLLLLLLGLNAGAILIRNHYRRRLG
ncbi:MAG: phosphate transporter, inner rane subunit PstA [Anaerolineales bacterium]|nr:phosphate ABC transporter, inner membrane subunit PstA [Anaerolineales bacterium]MBM2843661.1 phosphate transporter, inner rane subunit PstA [Anaerolineales bacterium]